MTIRAARAPLLLLLEVLWAWPLAALSALLFTGSAGNGPTVLAPAIVVGGAALLVSALARFDISLMATRVAGVTTTLAAIAVVITIEYGASFGDAGARGAAMGAGLALAGVWIRGVLRPREIITMEAVARSTLLGLVPVTLAAAIDPPVNGPQIFGEVAIVYVPLALLVLAVHRAGDAGRPITALAPQWGPVVVAAFAAGALLALVAAAVDPGSFGFLGPLARPLRDGSERLARALDPLFAGLAWLLRLLPDFNLPTREGPPPQLPEERPPDEDGDDGWGLPIHLIMNGLVGLAVALFVLLGLAYLFVRRRAQDEDVEPDDDHQRGVRDGGGAFEALSRRFRRGPAEARSRYAIRRLYSEVLGDAAAAGLERPPAATPLQFAPALRHRFGDTLPSEITDAFIASRYGEEHVDEAHVRDLEHRWRARRRQG